MDIQCKRLGYDGPITLELANPDSGFRLLNNVLSAKATAVKPIILWNSEKKVGDLLTLRIIGRATAPGVTLTSTVGTSATVRAKSPQLAYAPAWQDGRFSVVAAKAAAAFFNVDAPTEAVYLAQQVGQTSFALNVKDKHKDFKTPITIVGDALPVGYTLAIKQDKDKYNVTLSGPKEAAEGPVAIKLVCFGDLKGRGRMVSKEIKLAVVNPLRISAVANGPLVPGQTQKVKVSLNRRGSDKQPVTVKWSNLPAGVSSPDFTLTAEQNEMEVELTAAADAKVGTYADLTVDAVSKYAGTAISAKSDKVTLEVKAP